MFVIVTFDLHSVTMHYNSSDNYVKILKLT